MQGCSGGNQPYREPRGRARAALPAGHGFTLVLAFRMPRARRADHALIYSKRSFSSDPRKSPYAQSHPFE